VSSEPSAFHKTIRYLKGVGEKRAGLLGKLGVDTVGALLRFYPRAYIDWTHTLSIAEAPYDEVCCIAARAVEAPRKSLIRKGMTLYKFLATDDSSDMMVTLFNSPYLAEKIKEDTIYLFRGKVSGGFSRREMSAPEILPMDTALRIRPVYPQTEGLPSRVLSGLVEQALDLYLKEVPETLPEGLQDTMDLCTLPYALQNIHRPSSQDALEEARRRLIFEELLVWQLGLFQLKGRARETTSLSLPGNFTDEFYSLLPFSPTGAQKRVIHEALRDLSGPHPMNRLVQGDVGSGKTVIAAALCHHAYKNGTQSAIMAPTEILAEQHHQFLSRIFKDTPMKIALLTSSTPKKEKERIYAQLSDGEIHLIIGTHALLSDKVVFSRLALIVTDEQHRFGVEQRARLAEKGDHSHVLVMSATPIPRTLALVVYGDLDVSVLDELPPGRRPCETYVVTSEKRERALRFIARLLSEGRQAYLVCPLVEEGGSDLAAATQYAQELRQGTLRRFSVGLLHGRMKSSEKEAVMRDFSENKIQLLVSTTVVEVGVDVPNAAVMLIENAERFGLSQLHQLRGRVGRGGQRSYCILISDAQGKEAQARFEAIRSTTDGFKIADADLALRGPGDFFGQRQHGLPVLKVANLVNDLSTVTDAQRTAQKMIAGDPELVREEHRYLRLQVEQLYRESADN